MINVSGTPFSPECAGEFDIKHWAQHGRYHPQYLSSWRGLTTGFQSTGLREDFYNPSSSSWNELELNYGPSARLLGTQSWTIREVSHPRITYLLWGAKTKRLWMLSQNDERNRTLYRRSFQGSLVQLSADGDDADEPEPLKDNLVITGDLSFCDSAEPSNTDVLCLPSPARVLARQEPFRNCRKLRGLSYSRIQEGHHRI